MKRFLTPLALAALASPAVALDDYEAAARAYAAAAAWASDPMLVDAIVTQNARTGGLSPEQINEMDLVWRAEIGASETPTIDSVMMAPASDFLRARVAEAGGTISEAFVMDEVGLNVASSGITSDYWQGDEEKFTETYPMGPGAMHVGPLEFDESSQTFQVQVSMPIVDASGAVVGAITLGLNAEAL